MTKEERLSVLARLGYAVPKKAVKDLSQERLWEGGNQVIPQAATRDQAHQPKVLPCAGPLPCSQYVNGKYIKWWEPGTLQALGFRTLSATVKNHRHID